MALIVLPLSCLAEYRKRHGIDILPTDTSEGFPCRRQQEFLVHQAVPSPVPFGFGLTVPPQAATACPAADWRSPSANVSFG